MKIRRDDRADDESFDESVDENFAASGTAASGTAASVANDIERGGDVDVTRHRLEKSRLRRAQQNRRLLQILLLCIVVFVLVTRWRSPSAPQISVAWPSQSLGSSTLPDGVTISMRGGQPFVVTIQNAAQWRTTWKWNGGEGEGLPMRWSPVGNSDILTLRCRAKPQGAQVLWSWIWPTRVLVVNGTAPVALGRKRFIVVPLPGAPVRISSRVVVTTEARWHEDALPLLEAAARNKTLKSGAMWTLVASNDGKTPARDDSTYAALSEFAFQSPVEALTQCARQIENLSPKTDIKWVARNNPTNQTPRAILWLDFEKRRKAGARGGWIVESGNGVAQPTKWWKESD